MGSYSSSSNLSTTSYANAPIAQENVTNPNNLSNSSNNKLGTEISGSSLSTVNNVLDAGAIDRAFSFGSDAVKLVADLTRQSNSSLLDASGQAIQQSQNIASNAQGDLTSNLVQNKTLVLGAVVVFVAYLWFRK